MGTRLRKISHSILLKTILFLLLLASVVGIIYSVTIILNITKGNIEIIFENRYIESTSFNTEHNHTLYQLSELIDTYKSEEHILAGQTVNKEEFAYQIERDYWEYQDTSMTEAEIEEEIREKIIAGDLDNYKEILSDLKRKDEPLYYVTDGEHTFTNTKQTDREQFESYPVYTINEGYDWDIYPPEFEEQYAAYGAPYVDHSLRSEDTKFFVGYTKDFINTASSKWSEKKQATMQSLYYLIGFLVLFFACFLYLIVTTGRNSFQDKNVQMQTIDKLYVDVQIFILIGFLGFSFITGIELMTGNWMMYPIIVTLVAFGVILCLSMIRHMKNNSFFRHSALYKGFRFLYTFLQDMYASGSVGMKVMIVVIAYPILAAATLIFFPVIVGIAVWLALRKVKDFNALQEGAKKMREGNLEHRIDVVGSGEFATLAENINGINEGFKQAVHNELKNERMKTELITNVSHDIRTPLTSLITYTDLLKRETDPGKIQEYVTILAQKSKRLQVLTEDLFAAAKASSGDIPVDIQKIDLIALLNQGIGEVSDEISTKELSFKFNYPEEKMYVLADGNLLWRSIENILSNIFNYALEGSRVYLDIVPEEAGMTGIVFKNISKDELNITEEELMERFMRGDEARTSQGSGLGLSITKSLIENQQGTFEISIDGDLFKSMIYLPNAE